MSQNAAKRLEETKRHGSVLFPFNIYPCTIPKDFPTVALHWHRSMELIYIKKGMGLVQLGEEKKTARMGDIFIIPPETLHSLRGIRGESMEYENIIFDPDFLGSSAADVCAQKYLIPLTGGKLLQPLHLTEGSVGYERIAACLNTAEALCQYTQPGYELGVKGAMLQMLSHLIQLQPHPPSAESKRTALLREVLQQIQQDCATPLTVGKMAERCGFSPSHFMRWFRQMTGTSFGAYVKECRLAAAAERLRLTEDKILTVAGECGFESLANFNRQFRTRYGVTPSQYRNANSDFGASRR